MGVRVYRFFMLFCFLLRIVPVQVVSAQDYEAYHNYVNTAEKLLVNGKTDSALWYYDQAFAAYDFVFAKDAFI
ncbi:MAG TPA: hypothetical protein VL092_09510, partial [Chitinophagaceae bacterium]|nr:hypothetical protein [Chitinophagaceae bacterium]